MYVKKLASFCQVLKQMHTEENRFLFSASRGVHCLAEARTDGCGGPKPRRVAAQLGLSNHRDRHIPCPPRAHPMTSPRHRRRHIRSAAAATGSSRRRDAPSRSAAVDGGDVGIIGVERRRRRSNRSAAHTFGAGHPAVARRSSVLFRFRSYLENYFSAAVYRRSGPYTFDQTRSYVSSTVDMRRWIQRVRYTYS